MLMPVTAGSRWLSNEWKQPIRRQNFNTSEDHMVPLLRHIWARVVTVRHRRPRRRHLRRHRRKTKRRQVRMHVRTHKKEMWVETQEDPQKGVAWREMWRDAFGETKWRSHVEGDIVGNMPGDALLGWGTLCHRRALWGDCRSWRTHAGARTSPRGLQPMKEPKMRLLCSQQSPDRWGAIREIWKFPPL